MREVPLGRRRFISKYSARWLGTRSNLIRWGYRISARCQLCQQHDERVEHVLVCKNPRSNIHWYKVTLNLHQWFLKQDTDPGMAAILVRTLHAWRNNQPLPDTSHLGIWKDAFDHQSELGWQGFFEGFVSPKWAKYQQLHFNETNSRKTGRRWMVKLIKKLWDIVWDFWELRNSAVLEEEIRNSEPENEALNQQIEQEFVKGLDRIPARWTNLFHGSAAALKQKSTLYKKEWLSTVDKLRERHGGQDPISDRREFLLNWIN